MERHLHTSLLYSILLEQIVLALFSKHIIKPVFQDLEHIAL